MNFIKYPRTPHLPFSQGATSDDKFVSQNTLDYLKSGIDLVVTEKMDGGNLTFYREGMHARSTSGKTHAWDSAAKAVWSTVSFCIPEGWRISGESLYATRSIYYWNLPGPFMMFGIWNSENELLSWDETEIWAKNLDLPLVPVLYRGTNFDDAVSAWSNNRSPADSEGFVVRNAQSFHYDEFGFNVAKYVRSDHLQTDDDWRSRDDFMVNDFTPIESILSVE